MKLIEYIILLTLIPLYSRRKKLTYSLKIAIMQSNLFLTQWMIHKSHHISKERLFQSTLR